MRAAPIIWVVHRACFGGRQDEVAGADDPERVDDLLLLTGPESPERLQLGILQIEVVELPELVRLDPIDLQTAPEPWIFDFPAGREVIDERDVGHLYVRGVF